jgi:hypothetical protein
MTSYRASFAIRERLVAIDPANADWWRGMAISRLKMGRVEEMRQSWDAALAQYRAGLAIIERLLAARPDNRQWIVDREGFRAQIKAVEAKKAAAAKD